MKTDKKTVGFGGGITNAQTVRPKRCAAPVVQMRRCENARMAAKKDARPKRQLRTGASNCRPQLTEDSIARMPRWKRWGVVCARGSHHVWNHPGACMQRASLAMRKRGLVASRSALCRGWARSLARDVVMKAEVYRDNAGFWMARIEEDASTPENRGIGRVYRRQMLPVAPSASKAEAEAALRRVMSREARCPHGHR